MTPPATIAIRARTAPGPRGFFVMFMLRSCWGLSWAGSESDRPDHQPISRSANVAAADQGGVQRPVRLEAEAGAGESEAGAGEAGGGAAGGREIAAPPPGKGPAAPEGEVDLGDRAKATGKLRDPRP